MRIVKIAFSLIILLIVSACNEKISKSLFNYSNYSEQEMYLPDEHGYRKGFFYTYKDGVAENIDMTYKFTNKDEVYEFNYVLKIPSRSPEPDSLVFRIDFENLLSSFYIKKDVYMAASYAGERSSDDIYIFKSRTDTFFLNDPDTMIYFDNNELKFQTIYRFDFEVGDEECQTIFVNKEMGVFKRYGNGMYDCAEHYYPYGTLNHRKQITMLYILYMRKDFHRICSLLYDYNVKRYCGVTKYSTRPLKYN